MNNKIAIFVDHPRCAIDGVNSIINILDSKYRFKIFTKHVLPDNFFDDVDLIIIPGGLGDSETFHSLMKYHTPVIRDYILNKNGRYLGICMGAYWAGKHYFNILNNKDCVQFLNRPGSNTHRPHAKHLEVVWNDRSEKMFWYDGCSITGSGKFEVVSRYMNGDIMAGYQGRVGLIGSHPEADKNWYDSYSWMKKHWQSCDRNNKLLLQFVDHLISK